MAVRYLYNTKGDYVAFVANDSVFSPDCDWIGYTVSGNMMYTPDGRFVGYVMDDDRVVRNTTELARPRLARPVRPLRPMRPMRPLRRIRMASPQYPYVDVFEHGTVSGDLLLRPISTARFDKLMGCRIVAHDGEFLGLISKDRLRQDSLANQYGLYGSQYQSKSIFNSYGSYGNPYSALSPYNEYTATPPAIVCGDAIVGYLTANKMVSNRYDINEFIVWLNET